MGYTVHWITKHLSCLTTRHGVSSDFKIDKIMPCFMYRGLHGVPSGSAQNSSQSFAVGSKVEARHSAFCKQNPTQLAGYMAFIDISDEVFDIPVKFSNWHTFLRSLHCAWTNNTFNTTANQILMIADFAIIGKVVPWIQGIIWRIAIYHI